jgi:hypothetical protein
MFADREDSASRCGFPPRTCGDPDLATFRWKSARVSPGKWQMNPSPFARRAIETRRAIHGTPRPVRIGREPGFPGTLRATPLALDTRCRGDTEMGG